LRSFLGLGVRRRRRGRSGRRLLLLCVDEDGAKKYGY
jgi:hypothetical protein